jgi:hypothetical protein
MFAALARGEGSGTVGVGEAVVVGRGAAPGVSLGFGSPQETKSASTTMDMASHLDLIGSTPYR